MDKYLQQILNEVNTIIIPGLGALTLTNKTSGDIMFMSFLKHDDGNLSKYIAEKEGVAENDAKNLIAKYVREIQTKLDAGDTYDMYQFGRFVKNAGGIEFENWNSYQHDAISVSSTEQGKEEVKLELVADPILETIDEKTPSSPEPIPTPEPTPIVEPVIEKKADPVLEIIPSTPEPTIITPVVEAVVPEEKTESKLDVSAIKPNENVYIPEKEVKELEKTQESKPIEKTPPVAKITTKTAPVTKVKTPKVPKVKKKRSPLYWAMIAVGVIILIGGIGTAIFFKEVKEIISGKEKTEKTLAENQKTAEEESKEQEAIEQQVELEPAPIEEITPPVEETPKVEEEIPAPAPTQAPSGNGGSFHIIAGGFASESNANRFAQKLQGEGKSSSVLGKFDDLYLVSYESFSSQQEASAALKNASIKGWVFKYPK